MESYPNMGSVDQTPISQRWFMVLAHMDMFYCRAPNLAL